MLKEQLLDEDVKKKKRRVLVLLLALFMLGTMAALPLVDWSSVASAPTSQAVARASTSTPAQPTRSVLANRASPTPTPTLIPTKAKPQPTGTSSPTPAVPTATEVFAGAGGGESGLSPTPTFAGVTPTARSSGGVGGGATVTSEAVSNSPTPVSPTPTALSALPITGTERAEKTGQSAWGLVAILLGASLLWAGAALHHARLRSKTAAATADSPIPRRFPPRR